MGKASPQIRARRLACGAQFSAHLGVVIMRHCGLDDVERVDARALLTCNASAKFEEDRFLDAEVSPQRNVVKGATVSCGRRVVLTQGGVASTDDGVTCMLGSGGSVTSGSLLAALLGASKYEIWAEVHGIYTCDPRYAPEARLIRRMDYREAQALVALGAKPLNPQCIEAAQWACVPIKCET